MEIASWTSKINSWRKSRELLNFTRSTLCSIQTRQPIPNCRSIRIQPSMKEDPAIENILNAIIRTVQLICYLLDCFIASMVHCFSEAVELQSLSRLYCVCAKRNTISVNITTIWIPHIIYNPHPLTHSLAFFHIKYTTKYFIQFNSILNTITCRWCFIFNNIVSVGTPASLENAWNETLFCRRTVLSAFRHSFFG